MSVTLDNKTIPLEFTDNAARKVGELIAEEENLNLKLRVFITGGGCSGLQYGFTFDESINDDDFILEKDLESHTEKEDAQDDDGGDSNGGFNITKVILLVDSTSFQYLQDAKIDYQQGINGEHFVIRNPNAKTTCGCGSSFSV